MACPTCHSRAGRQPLCNCCRLTTSFYVYLFLLSSTFVAAQNDKLVALSFPPLVQINHLRETINGIVPEMTIGVRKWCNSNEIESPQISWNCRPIQDLVVCMYAGAARQYCLPVLTWMNMTATMRDNEMGAPRIDYHHLPVGSFDLVAHLMWIDGKSPSGSSLLVSSSDPFPVTRDVSWSFEKADQMSSLLPLERNSATLGLRLGMLRHGPMMYNINDSPAGESLYLFGEWEESSLRLLVSVLQEGDVVLDIGAHIGSFTVPLSRAVGTSGRVFAFEPQQELFQTLQGNLALNGLLNAQVLKMAVTDTSTTFDNVAMRNSSLGISNFGAFSLKDLVSPKQHQEQVITNESEDRFKVPMSSTKPSSSSYLFTSFNSVDTISLDQLFLLDQVEEEVEHSIRCPKLMKVDVENLETSVLRGGRRLIEKCKPLLYLENQCRTTSKDLILELTRLNYVCFWDPAPYHPRDHNAMNFYGSAEGFSIEGISLNILCLPQRGPDIEKEHVPTRVESVVVEDEDSMFDLWLVLGDVLSQLTMINPLVGYLVEDYNPVKYRRDSGAGSNEVGVAMANC